MLPAIMFNTLCYAASLVALASQAIAVIVGEAGVVTVDNTWTSVSFSSRIDSPVVVAKSPTQNGGDPTTVRIRNISPNGFQVQLQEFDYLDGSHTSEELGWVAVQSGHHSDPSSSLEVDAGIVPINGTTQANEPFMGVPFSGSFGSNPVVASVVVSTNGNQAVTTRNRGVNRNGFEVAMQEQESFSDGHVPEFVAYVAFSGESDRLITGFEDFVDENFSQVGPFPRLYDPLVVVADAQTYNGADTVVVRVSALDGNQFNVRVQEEQSRDNEVAHTNELIGYIAASPGSLG